MTNIELIKSELRNRIENATASIKLYNQEGDYRNAAGTHQYCEGLIAALEIVKDCQND